jgi:hypothetical protein
LGNVEFVERHVAQSDTPDQTLATHRHHCLDLLAEGHLRFRVAA